MQGVDKYLREWLATDAFLDIWKVSFARGREAFKNVSPSVRASSKRERTGGLWTQLNHPYPGIHLLAIELQPDVDPLVIKLKLWIDERSVELYQRLRMGAAPQILGQQTTIIADQRPRASWAAQLRASELSLKGLLYIVDAGWLRDSPDLVRSRLEAVGQEFFVWTLAAASAPALKIPVLRTLQDVYSDLEHRVAESLHAGANARRSRLVNADPHPKRVVVQTSAFVRNADVIVEVLHRARGTCEACGQAAPFLRTKDDTPYLEVHHRLPLASGGEDTVANAVALCPNCHRRNHYGTRH